MERVIAGVTVAHRATYRFDYEVGYDPVVNDRDASAAVQRAIVAELGEEALVEVQPVMGGEDFSAYGAVAPAVVLLGRLGQRGARDDVPASPSALRHRRGGPARRDRRLRPYRARRSRLGAPAVAGKGTPAIVAAERAGDRVHGARVRPRPEGAVVRARGGGEARHRPRARLQDARRGRRRRAHGRDRAGRGAARPPRARGSVRHGRREARGAHDRLRRRAGSARSGSASGCRRCSTSRRSASRRSTSAQGGAGSRSSSRLRICWRSREGGPPPSPRGGEAGQSACDLT